MLRREQSSGKKKAFEAGKGSSNLMRRKSNSKSLKKQREISRKSSSSHAPPTADIERDLQSAIENDINNLAAKLTAVESEINQTKNEIETATEMIKRRQGEKEKDYWIKEKQYLREKEKDLREEKKDLREEKNLLLREKFRLSAKLESKHDDDIEWVTCSFASNSVIGTNFSFNLPQEVGDCWQLIDIGLNATAEFPIRLSLYARKDTIDFFSFISHEWDEFKTVSVQRKQNKVAFVNGPPGVGKSCAVLSWAMNFAAAGNAKVLWFRSAQGLYLFTEELQNGKFLFHKVFTSSQRIKAIEKVTTRSEESIIIFDGFVQDDNIDKMVLNSFGVAENAFIVACTSYQSGHYNGDRTAMMQYPNMFIADSWSLAEVNAAKIAMLWDQKIDEVYYFSGGSIRSFRRGEEGAKSLIDAAVERVTDYTALLRQRLGDAANSAINSLMYIRKNKQEVDKLFVSDYAQNLIVEKDAQGFIKQAENYCRTNKQLQGWVFEMKVLDYLKYPVSQWLDIQDLPDENILNWPIRPALTETIMNAEDIATMRIALKDWIYIFPGRPTQRLFDFLIVDSTKATIVLYVVQITMQRKHSYKLDELTKWLPKIRKKWKIRKNDLVEVRIVQLSPKNIANDVSFSNLEEEIQQIDSEQNSTINLTYFAVGVHDQLRSEGIQSKKRTGGTHAKAKRVNKKK